MQYKSEDEMKRGSRRGFGGKVVTLRDSELCFRLGVGGRMMGRLMGTHLGKAALDIEQNSRCCFSTMTFYHAYNSERYLLQND